MREAKDFSIAPAERIWFNLWHHHLGLAAGNGKHRRWKCRLQVIQGLAMVFERIASLQRQFALPFQLWIYLSGSDSSQDAVYLHTPNPHTVFPVEWADVGWGDWEMLPFTREMLPNYPIRVGRGKASFLIYSPDIGVPLE